MKKIIATLLAVLTLVSALSLSAVAAPGRPQAPDKPTGTGQAPVCFYISRWGTQLDTEGNIDTRDSNYFSDIVGRTNLNKKMDTSESIVIGKDVTEEDILARLNNSPADSKVFLELTKEYKRAGAVLYTNSGKIVDWNKLNKDNYGIRWYVLKIENDGWHVDGYVYELETNENVNTVLPDETEDFEKVQEEQSGEDVELEAEGVGSVVVETVDTSIHLKDVKYAYIFGYEPIITEVVDETTGEKYTTAEIEMGMDSLVSMEEVCAMLVRILDQAGFTSGTDFPVVDQIAPHAGQWYERGLAYLYSVGGFDDGEPIQIAPVTRAQVAKLVASALKLNLSAETPFVDVEGNRYESYIEKVYKYGYMNGVGDNKFNPDAYMTRAEFCALFNNILGRNDFGLTALDENGEEYKVTAEDYFFVDMDPSHWAYEVCLKATSAYDDNGYVDIASRMENIRNIIDRHEAQKEY